jgi:hypothetical protein
MSPRVFMRISKITFLRYNYRHFHAKLLPAWAEEDALLAQRVENVLRMMRALGCHGDSDNSLDLHALLRPFTRPLSINPYLFADDFAAAA